MVQQFIEKKTPVIIEEQIEDYRFTIYLGVDRRFYSLTITTAYATTVGNNLLILEQSGKIVKGKIVICEIYQNTSGFQWLPRTAL